MCSVCRALPSLGHGPTRLNFPGVLLLGKAIHGERLGQTRSPMQASSPQMGFLPPAPPQPYSRAGLPFFGIIKEMYHIFPLLFKGSQGIFLIQQQFPLCCILDSSFLNAALWASGPMRKRWGWGGWPGLRKIPDERRCCKS